jgi:hypothetical protein
MAKPEVFKKVLKEGEDVDEEGVPGQFEIKCGYSACILSTADPDDETI